MPGARRLRKTLGRSLVQGETLRQARSWEHAHPAQCPGQPGAPGVLPALRLPLKAAQSCQLPQGKGSRWCWFSPGPSYCHWAWGASLQTGPGRTTWGRRAFPKLQHARAWDGGRGSLERTSGCWNHRLCPLPLRDIADPRQELLDPLASLVRGQPDRVNLLGAAQVAGHQSAFGGQSQQLRLPCRGRTAGRSGNRLATARDQRGGRRGSQSPPCTIAPWPVVTGPMSKSQDAAWFGQALPRASSHRRYGTGALEAPG